MTHESHMKLEFVSINKVLLKHSPTQVFMYCLWLLSRLNDRTVMTKNIVCKAESLYYLGLYRTILLTYKPENQPNWSLTALHGAVSTQVSNSREKESGKLS